MKHSLKTTLFLAFISLSVLAQQREEYQLGLASRLIDIKSITEDRMMLLMSDTAFYKKNENKINSAYNNVRLDVDKLVIQLSIDCQRRNRIIDYRRIDKFYKGKKAKGKSAGYLSLLSKMDADYENFLSIKNQETQEATLQFTLGEIDGVALLGSIISTIDAAAGKRREKVEGITTTLDLLRLLPISKIGKPEEKKEDKDE